MTTHPLKTAPEHFQALLDGTKTAELRKDDRGYAVGDVLVLREWDEAEAWRIYAEWEDNWPGAFNSSYVGRAMSEAEARAYTGRELRRVVSHIVHVGSWLVEGNVMLSLKQEGTQDAT